MLSAPQVAAAPVAVHAPEAQDLAVGADGWIDVARPHVGPLITAQGTVKGRREVIEPADLERLAQNVADKALDPKWTGVPVFVGHGFDEPAVAWVRLARVLGGVLQVLPEWSEHGLELLRNKAYKLISGAWAGSYDQAGDFRPAAFDHVALTNRPLISGLAPVVNAAAEPATADGGQADGGSAPEPPAGAEPAPAPGTHSAANSAAGKSDKSDVSDRSDRSDSAAVPAGGGVRGAAAAPAQGSAPEQKARGAGPAVQQDAGVTGQSPVLLSAPPAIAPAVHAAVVARVAELEEALQAERLAAGEALVELAIERGIVAGRSRDRALQIVAQNREAAVRCWFGSPGVLLPSRVPRDPLRGRRLPHGLPAAAGPAIPEPAAVHAAVGEYMAAHPGTAYPTAFNAVYAALESVERRA